jgi:hypothetical protein
MSPVFTYLCKVAADKGRRDKALRTIDSTRPYLQKGVAGAAGGLWAGSNINKLRRAAQAAETAGATPRRGLPIALAVLGAALGLGDEKLRRLAHEAKYRSVLKQTRATT